MRGGARCWNIRETKEGIAAKVQHLRPHPTRSPLLKHLSGTEWAKPLTPWLNVPSSPRNRWPVRCPRRFEEAFAAAGVSLFPDKHNELVTSCSCPDYANPCNMSPPPITFWANNLTKIPFCCSGCVGDARTDHWKRGACLLCRSMPRRWPRVKNMWLRQPGAAVRKRASPSSGMPASR